MEISEDIIAMANEVYRHLRPYCISIYLGGSSVQGFIRNPHDVDFILFADLPVNMCHIRRLMHFYKKRNNLDPKYDFIQVRTKRREEHNYGSYINKQMVKLVGEDIEFKFDVIGTDRWEYKEILKDTIDKLDNGKIRNQKRWYQVLYGYYILSNNSYELTEDQKNILNIVHDQTGIWKKYKITKAQVDAL